MTYKQVFNYLMTPRHLERQIWIAGLEYAELESCLLPAAVKYDKDFVQTSPNDAIGDVAARLDDIDRKIKRLKRKKADALMDIGQNLKRLGDHEQQIVLQAYFIGQQSVKTISEYMYRSTSSIYAIRRKGIEEIKKILENESV